MRPTARQQLHPPLRRVQVTFWLLVVVAVVAAGGLSWALDAPPGWLAGATFAASGLLLTLAATLALRILWWLGRR